MKLAKLATKIFFYFAILWPFTTGLVSVILGRNFFGATIGFFATIGLIYFLEQKGHTNRVLDAAWAAAFGGASNQSNNTTTATFSEPVVEKIIECPNCGDSVTLLNGRGQCKACDTKF